ncbi:MAG: tripartite tricarboxylate transporter substrate-binding protein [Burkholderiales bacterium]
MAYARAKPGQMSYASAGVGTPHHLAAELFKSRAGGLNIVHVPYKGGGPAAIAIMGGEAQMMFVSFAASLAHVKAKKLKALAVTGPQRSPEVPHVPTMQEEGFAGFDVRAWFGVLAPAGTPLPVIRRLNAELVKAARSPELIAAMATQGTSPASNTPEEFARFIREEQARFAQIVRESGVKAD